MGLRENITAARLGEVQRGGGCPRSGFLNLGLGLRILSVGLAMPTGLKRYYGQGDLHFIYVQLPSAVAAVEYVSRAGHAREGVGESARQNARDD